MYFTDPTRSKDATRGDSCPKSLASLEVDVLQASQLGALRAMLCSQRQLLENGLANILES